MNDADYRLAIFLESCFLQLAIKEEELESALLKILWDREEDPPLWAAEMIDAPKKKFPVFGDMFRPDIQTSVFTDDEVGAIWAISLRRRGIIEVPGEPGRVESRYAAFHRNPHIGAWFRELFPDIAWEDPPK
ncbi:MAG: hypothetical protein AAF909_12455 [Pseudomonadota bacterium]